MLRWEWYERNMPVRAKMVRRIRTMKMFIRIRTLSINEIMISVVVLVIMTLIALVICDKL